MGGVIAAAIAVGVAILSSASPPPAASSGLYTCASVTPVSGNDQADGMEMPSQTSVHVAVGSRIRYAACPPTSGNHFAARGAGPIPPGFQAPDSSVVPNGWVHNLEHGYVVVLYRTRDGVPDEATLRSLQAFETELPVTAAATRCGYRSKSVVAPFDDMATPFAVLAWNRLLQLDRWDPDRAWVFAERWAGVTAPEPNAC